MPIALRCKCGKQLTVKDDASGRVVKCPGCAAPLKVPSRPATRAPVAEDLAESLRVVDALREQVRLHPDQPGWNEVCGAIGGAKKKLLKRYVLVAFGAATVVAVIVWCSQGGAPLSLGLGVGVGLFYLLPVSADVALRGAPRKPEGLLGEYYGAIALGRMELAYALLLPSARVDDRQRGAWPPLGLDAATESFATLEGFRRYWAALNRESITSVIGAIVGMSVERDIRVVDQCRIVDEPDFVVLAAVLETSVVKKSKVKNVLTTWKREGGAFTIQPLALVDGRWYMGRGTFLSDEELVLAPLLRGKAPWGDNIADAAREVRAARAAR